MSIGLANHLQLTFLLGQIFLLKITYLSITYIEKVTSNSMWKMYVRLDKM